MNDQAGWADLDFESLGLKGANSFDGSLARELKRATDDLDLRESQTELRDTFLSWEVARGVAGDNCNFLPLGRNGLIQEFFRVVLR